MKRLSPLLFIAIVLVGSAVFLTLSSAQGQGNGIVADNADWLSTGTLLSSDNLIAGAAQVSTRMVVEYSGSVSQPVLLGSDELERAAGSVTPTVIVEYGSSLSKVDLRQPDLSTTEAGTAQPRIIVEYGGSLADQELGFPSFLPEPTGMTLNPSSFDFEPGESTSLTATLRDFSGNAMVGRTITWESTSGVLKPSSGTTDSDGQLETTYAAAPISDNNSVTVTASFSGDSSYRASAAKTVGTLTGLPLPTSIVTAPSDFSIQSEQTLTITATLKAGGNPLPNRTISWQTKVGDSNPLRSTTDASGQVTTSYKAPRVNTETPVTLVASFAGDVVYQPARVNISCRVIPPRTPSPIDGTSHAAGEPTPFYLWALAGLAFIGVVGVGLAYRKHHRSKSTPCCEPPDQEGNYTCPEEEDMQIKQLIDETEQIVAKAEDDATGTGDSLWLSALKVLEAELSELSLRFAGGQIRNRDARDRILDLRQQAQVLATQPNTKKTANKAGAAEPDEVSLEDLVCLNLGIRRDSDGYEVLGIPREATKEAVDHAYKEKIREWHPDRFVTERGKEVSNAVSKRINQARDEIHEAREWRRGGS